MYIYVIHVCIYIIVYDAMTIKKKKKTLIQLIYYNNFLNSNVNRKFIELNRRLVHGYEMRAQVDFLGEQFPANVAFKSRRNTAFVF